MSAYLLLKNLQVHHVNAMNTFYCVGAPAPTALVGFGIACAMQMNVEFDGVAVLHQGFEVEGRTRYRVTHPNLMRGLPLYTNYSERKSSLVLPDQPMVHGLFDTSLVLRVPDEDLGAMQGAVQDGTLQHWLQSRGKIAGGTVQKMDPPVVFADLKGLDKALRSVRGLWLMDRQDLLSTENRCEGENQLQAAVRCLYAVKEENKKRVSVYPWLMLTCMGYHRVTDYVERAGAREGMMHAFAEPLTGLVDLQSKRNVDLTEAEVFWNYKSLDAETMVVQQSSRQT